MRAGKLRYRVAIEERTDSQNEYGEIQSTWATRATLWASRADLTGSELFQAQQVNAQVSTRFETRYFDWIVPTMRLRHHNTLYNIESVQTPDGKRLILICSRNG